MGSNAADCVSRQIKAHVLFCVIILEIGLHYISVVYSALGRLVCMSATPRYMTISSRTARPLSLLFNDNMQFEFVDDDIGDHTPLDDQVYTACESICIDEPPPAAILLQEIVSSAQDELDRKFLNYQTTKKIVAEYSLNNPDGDENSNLTKLLEWCWRRGTFKKIRCLSECNYMNIFLSYISQNCRNSATSTCIFRSSQLGAKHPVSTTCFLLASRLTYFACLAFITLTVGLLSQPSVHLLIVPDRA